MALKFSKSIITKSNDRMDLTPEIQQKANAATQTLAIIAEALGLSKPVSSFTPKGETEARYFISPDTCQEILRKLGE